MALEAISDLSDDHKQRLKDFMLKMGSYYPIQRISIKEAIEQLSRICQERVLPAKLNYLKQHYPVYQILSSYSQLFAIDKLAIQSDEKKINHFLQALVKGKTDLGCMEKEVDQITKAWHAIKKSNASPIFDDIFKILSRCLIVSEQSSKQNEFSVKAKRKIVTYLKTHMKDMITKQDIYGSKRLKAISHLLDELENPNLKKVNQVILDENLARILSHQFDKSLSRPVVNLRYTATGFFTTKGHPREKVAKSYDFSRDSGIESGISLNSLNP